MKSRSWSIAGVALLPLTVPLVASAHAFGQQYTLPLPLSFYIVGGVSAFVASCAVIFLFSDPRPASEGPRVLVVRRLPPAVAKTLRWSGITLAFLLLGIAVFGSQNWYENPVEDIFWVWLLLGFTYVNVFVAGLWDYINPFKTIARWVGELTPDTPSGYPSWLGYVPVIILFFGLVSLELFSNGLGTYPIVLAGVFMLYALICNFGSAAFGIDAWFYHADFFTVFFDLVGTFAPVRLKETTLEITYPGERLVAESASRADLILFVLFILAATALDGLKDTGVWNLVVSYYLPHWGIPLDPNIFGMLMLLIVPFVFFGLYILAIALGRALTRTTLTLRHLVLRFGYSLVPIAVAYHFAHYFDFLIGEVQRPIPLLSDPLTRGWNLFGTKAYVVNLIPLGADTIWYVQLGAIVLGHIIAAVIAHRIAVRTFTSKRDIILSQLPMLVLMVFYTALGLWILAQR